MVNGDLGCDVLRPACTWPQVSERKKSHQDAPTDAEGLVMVPQNVVRYRQEGCILATVDEAVLTILE